MTPSNPMVARTIQPPSIATHSPEEMQAFWEKPLADEKVFPRETPVLPFGSFWLRDLPTEEGWYWVKLRGAGKDIQLARVFQNPTWSHDRPFLMCHRQGAGSMNVEPLANMHAYEFAGPLPRPE